MFSQKDFRAAERATAAFREQEAREEREWTSKVVQNLCHRFVVFLFICRAGGARGARVDEQGAGERGGGIRDVNGGGSCGRAGGRAGGRQGGKEGETPPINIKEFE